MYTYVYMSTPSMIIFRILVFVPDPAMPDLTPQSGLRSLLKVLVKPHAVLWLRQGKPCARQAT